MDPVLQGFENTIGGGTIGPPIGGIIEGKPLSGGPVAGAELAVAVGADLSVDLGDIVFQIVGRRPVVSTFVVAIITRQFIRRLIRWSLVGWRLNSATVIIGESGSHGPVGRRLSGAPGDE